MISPESQGVMNKKRGGSQVRSLFGEAARFRAAMEAEGVRGFVVPRSGQFRAQLTQVALNRMQLTSVEEALPSVSFIGVPRGKVLAAFALDDRTKQVWGGCRVAANSLVLVGPGQGIHRRSDEASHWGIIWFPTAELRDCTRSVLGKAIRIPSMGVWRLPISLNKRLRGLQKSVMGTSRARSMGLLHPQAAHGLEQQVIDILMEALSASNSREPTATPARRKSMAILERLTAPGEHTSMTQLSSALDIPGDLLRRWCEETLGMDPMSYITLRNRQSGMN